MLYRTLIDCKARKTPAIETENVAFIVKGDTVLSTIGDSIQVGELTFHPFDIENQQVWIAEATANQTPILIAENPTDTAFDKAFRFVIRQEGGYLSEQQAKEQGDRGGATKFGISQKFNPDVDVHNLTLSQAKEIYYRKYWLDTGCINLEPALAFCHFDASINCGPSTAQGFLLHSRGEGYKAYCKLRKDYYQKIGLSNPQFLDSWLRRLGEVEAFAEDLDFPF